MKTEPSFSDLFRVFGRIGLLSFGGPAAQIALMHRTLVDDHKWISDSDFLRALSFCMLLPGPEAMQLATYAGWRLRGILGGLMGGMLFVLPGAIVIFALALIYARFGDLPFAQSLFVGVKATVVVIVLDAILKLSRRALKTRTHIAIALAAFGALFAFGVPFPIVIAVAAAIGAVGTAATAPPQTPVHLTRPAVTLAIGAAVWLLPLLLLTDPFLTQVATFFATLAIVTFGGAYAVLTYMTQEVVTQLNWLTAGQMLDALGLAETTPGPLILVTQFVAIIADTNRGGGGVFAGLLALWVTFVPCFVWIFAGAPLIDWIAGRPRLTNALAAVTAAVVGVIGSLSLWFATHVFFAELMPWWGAMSRPVVSSFDPLAAGLAGFAAVLLLWRKQPVLLTLAIVATTGVCFELWVG